MPTGAWIKVGATGVETVTRGFNRMKRGIQEVGKSGDFASRKVSRGLGVVRSKLRGVYGLAGGVGAVGALKKVLDWKDGLGQLQADIGLTTKESLKMEEQILATSDAFNASKAELVGALQVYQDFGGIVDKGLSTLDELAKRHRATGTSAADLATIHSTLIQTLNQTPEEGIAGIDAMIAQSLAGQISLRKLAKALPEVLAGGTGYGFKGKRGIEQLGTALQVAGQATGGKSEEARTMVKALLRDLTAQKSKFAKLGIRVFDKEGNMRDLDELMGEVITKTGGKMSGKHGLAKLFTADSQVIAAAYASSFDLAAGKYRKGGTVSNVLAAGRGSSAKTADDMYKRRTEGISSQSERVQKSLRELETGLLRHGGNLIEWIGGDVGRAGLVAGGAGVAIKAAPAIISKAFMSSKAFSALGPFGKGLAAASKALFAFSAGFTIGTILDQMTGASDQISDWLFDLANPGERDLRNKAAVEASEKKRRVEEAKTYAQGRKKDTVEAMKARARELGKVAGAPAGKRGKAAFAASVGAIGEEGGLSKEEVAKLIPTMEKIASSIEAATKQKPEIIIKPAGGVEKAEAKVKRGPWFLYKD